MIILLKCKITYDTYKQIHKYILFVNVFKI